jgi:V8-like Glu-specific endopeptidase
MKFKRFFAAVSATMLSSTLLSIIPLKASATTIYGDANNDGRINISDCVQISTFLKGKASSSSVNLKYADVDKNTVIDINDFNTIMQYIGQNVSSLPYSESSATFDYYSYTFPTDDSRGYVKYDCSTEVESNYTLSPSSAMMRSGSYDDRELDSSDNAQCIVYLTFTASDGEDYRGTGFIIDDHVIATCAHNLYDGNEFNTNYTIKVYDSAGTSVVQTYSASELHIPSVYYNHQDRDYDYGLIYVEDDLSEYGTMPLGIATNNFKSTSQTVNVSGFPGKLKKDDLLILTKNRYYGVGNITGDTNDNLLWYTSYTSSGDSGGPVYIEYTLKGSTFRSAIGIHTFGNENVHGGTRITLPLLRFYNNNSEIGRSES